MAPPFMLGTHIAGAVVASLDGDVYEELWSELTSFLLA